MTKLLQEAIERVKELPEERQDELARALMQAAHDDGSDYQLSDEQVAEVERRMRIKNPKYVTMNELKRRIARWRA